MELILWRHADAENGEPDLLRELTPLGLRQAGHVADWLNVRLPSQCRIVCSPATRTQQTVDALGRDYEVEEALGPGADAAAVLRALHWPHGNGTVLAVGHQPTLGRLAATLMTGRPHDWDIARGALWWFDLREPYNPHSLTLKAVIIPELILK